MTPRKKKILKWVAVAALVLAVLWTGWNGLASRRLAAAVSEHAAAGFPTTFAQLKAHRGQGYFGTAPLAKHENAAYLYSAAFSLAARYDVENPVWPEDGGVPPVSQETRESIAQLGDAFALLHRAADMPRCQYAMEFSDGRNMRMGHIPRVQNARNLLVCRAVLRLEDGDASGALDDTRALFALARSPREDPMLIAQIVYVSMTGDAARLLERVLPLVEDPAAALEAVEMGSVNGAIATGMRGEYVYGLAALTERSIPPGWFLESTLLWPKSKTDLARSGLYLRRYAELCELPYLEGLERMTELESEAVSEGGIYGAIFLPGVVRVREREAEVEARLALAKVAAVCLAQRKAEGAWPASLDGLSVPLDPLSGKPFVIETDGEGAVLRSSADPKTRWTLR